MTNAKKSEQKIENSSYSNFSGPSYLFKFNFYNKNYDILKFLINAVVPQKNNLLLFSFSPRQPLLVLQIMPTLRLVPISSDFDKPDTITISQSEQDKELILGRGKLTGIQDVRVSRNQIYANFHAPQNGEAAYLAITVVS